jgi:molybdopterin-guanine dinucleotide biosynthesis protein A
MGTDKALLEIDGRPLMLRVADRISPVCGSVTIVGDPVRYANPELRVVPDSFPGQGPLAGIEAALAATSAEANLIVACDMPSLDAATLEALFEAGADCAVPQYEDGKLEPLCAVYHRRCHSRVRELLETGVRKVTEALRLLETGGLEVRYLHMQARATFANLNTPGDLARYREGHG